MSKPAHDDPLVSFFDAAAADWDEHGPPLEKTLARLEELRAEMDLHPGQDVLEVGCGTGQVSAYLAEAVAPGTVTAVDFSPQMIERARARTQSLDVTFRLADICADDLGESAYDVAFCMHVFPHFRDAQAALNTLRRALRPEGRLLILHLANWREINDMHDRIGGAVAGHHLPPPGDWQGLLAGGGFALTTLRDEDDLLLVVATRVEE